VELLPCDIADLLEVAEATRPASSDLTSATQLLKACEPSLVLVADSAGRVIYADDLRSGMGTDAAGSMAVKLREKLIGNQTCKLEVSTDAGPHLAFAVRLPEYGEGGILACLVRASELCEVCPDEMQRALFVCAAFVWAARSHEADDSELRTRVKQLLAQQETLKNSHAAAVTTAIEEHEQRLQQQQQDMARLQAVMMLAADGIATIDEQGVVESFNQAAGRIFGYDPNEVIGRNISMLIPAPYHQRHKEQLAQYLAGYKTTISGLSREVSGQRKDGTTFPLDLAVSEVSLGNRRIFTGIFRDITERKRLEGQLAQAQKLESVGQLAAGIAHEINTPTQYIGDNTRFLHDSFEDLAKLLTTFRRLLQANKNNTVSDDLLEEVEAAIDEADLEYLLKETPDAIQQTLEGVNRVSKIVHSMKEFSHPGSEQKQAVDLNRAVENALTISRNEWKYVAETVTELDPNLPLVDCLPGECNQAILNLIINAAHAISDGLGTSSTEKGTITVSTRHDGDWAEIRVQDTGTGIPEEIQSTVFDPFFTTKEVGRGTGQGLAIAHSVVTDKHGGTITFETELGRGTTFIIRLPLRQESPSGEGAQDEEANPVC